jgi:hypothetical protein
MAKKKKGEDLEEAQKEESYAPRITEDSDLLSPYIRRYAYMGRTVTHFSWGGQNYEMFPVTSHRKPYVYPLPVNAPQVRRMIERGELQEVESI